MSERLRSPVVAVVAAIVLAVIVVAVGRAERAHQRAQQAHGIIGVRKLIGSEISHPADFRQSPGLNCLIYPVGLRVFALELCADPSGRVVEAVDRRGTDPVFYSVVPEPDASPLRLDPRRVAKLIAKLQPPPRKRPKAR